MQPAGKVPDMSVPRLDASAAPRWQWLLGREWEARTRMRLALLAAGLVLVCALIGLSAALWAGTAPWLAGLWAAAICIGQAAMVLTLRMGWSQRFKDPALTQAQMLFAMLMTALIYPMVGPMRGGVLPVFILILSFGMFQLSARQTLRQALAAVLLMLLAVLLHDRRQGSSATLAIDLAHLSILAVSVLGVSVLAMLLAGIREKLKRKRQELREALACIEELAARDALTGLYNRRRGEELLSQALARQARDGLPLSLLLLDLDHFKRINDEHGHAVGDAVLRHFARTTEDALRSTDQAVRWGGEEFLLLLQGADADVPLQRLHLAVASSVVHLPEGGELRYSYSGGLVRAQPQMQAERLLELADAALYRAKTAGRNQVVQA
jgi:diguanylate cyclase